MNNASGEAASLQKESRYSYVSLGLERVEWRGPRIIIAKYSVLDQGFPGLRPGQFILFWVPGFEAIPLSPIYSDKHNITILVKDRGRTTHRIATDPPQWAGAIGPLGRQPVFPPKGKKAIIVAGGVGVALAAPLAREMTLQGFNVTLIYGAKSEGELIPVEAYTGGARLVYATENGGKGVKGTVIDALEQMNIVDKDYTIYAAGPNPMLCTLYDWASNLDLLDALYLAPERIIKCGIGFCGRCGIRGTKLLLCRDGAYLPATKLSLWVEEGCPVN